MDKKIVLVHNGALGDFILAWPAIFSLSEHFKGSRCIWGGRASYLPWVKDLGLEKVDPLTRCGLDKVYTSQEWPAELKDTLVLWFCLKKRITTANFSQLIHIRGISAEPFQPVHKTYLNNLTQRLCLTVQDWRSSWLTIQARRIGPESNADPTKVLLFPGAGHQAKCWPLKNFTDLAEKLQNRGYHPLFVLGPAEIDRAIQIPDWPSISCTDLLELERLICTAGLIIGNDTGPLHLAGISQIPNLAMFGPTHPQQWRPLSGNIIWARHAQPALHDCSPCTQTGRISCKHPVCMQAIPLQSVLTAATQLSLRRGKASPPPPFEVNSNGSTPTRHPYTSVSGWMMTFLQGHQYWKN